MPKRTLANVCELHGITRDQLNAAKAAGVNVWNDKTFAAWLVKRRPKTANGAKLKLAPSEPVIPDDATPEQTLEMIERQLRQANDNATVTILKNKLAGLMIGIKVRAEAGELMPLGQVKEAMIRIVSETRGELLKLTSELPPQLTGETAPAIQKKLRAEITGILQRLHDNFEKG